MKKGRRERKKVQIHYELHKFKSVFNLEKIVSSLVCSPVVSRKSK